MVHGISTCSYPPMKNYILFTIIILLSLIYQNTIAQKIPIAGSHWYQQNYTSGGLNELFDGNKDSKAFTGWSKILSNYDAYYELLPGETMTIDSIRFYDKEGAFNNTPMSLFAINSNWERKLIATFKGDTYNAWVGPYPSRPGVIALDTPVTDVRFLVLNIYYNDFPGEIELYGPHTAGTTPTPATKTFAPLRNMFGINGFEWDVVDAVRPGKVNAKKFNALKAFRGFRHYIDWEKIEEMEGRYMFSPVARGGWQYDTIYKRFSEEGIDVLACLKTLPPWMRATWPAGQKSWDNNPVRYGSSYTNPASYIEMAKVAFQYVARYGSNANVDKSLVSVYSVPKWTGDPVNVRKTGMNLIKYIECDNERDKWWKGRNGYLTGREYAANLSAFYDGHNNTLGAGVGVKNADSTIQVVMTGTASTNTDYLRGMIDWCKEFRGYKGDSTVNLCWDVINFHFYCNDQGNSQSGNSTRGAAPEVSNVTHVIEKYLQVAHQHANDIPVWITEAGYDINQGSSLEAIPIGPKTAMQTQADWILRSALVYSREGLKKAFFYQVYDANINAPYKFSSSGLINRDTTRKPAADFLYQTNKLFGEYTYSQTLADSPMADVYTRNADTMYAVWMPTETGATASYTLNLPGASSITIYTPVAGQSDMDEQQVAVINGQVIIPATETPVFIVPTVNVFIYKPSFLVFRPHRISVIVKLSGIH